tara:strand:- start:514 stop:1272 length:759 start_codon:yes stop_codon:yes gene_type:complete
MNPSALNIVTVSVNSKIDVTVKVKDAQIIEWLKTKKDISFREKKKKKAVEGKKDRFFNCVMFYMQCGFEKPVHIKIFQNGSLQLSGVQTLDMEKIEEIIECILILVEEAAQEFPNLITVNSNEIGTVNITMVNSNFKISPDPKWKINQKQLQTIINNNYRIEHGGRWTGVTKTEKYPGLNGKYIYNKYLDDYDPHSKKKVKGQVTILIFRSGSIIITGYNVWEHGIEAYNEIVDIITKNFNEVCFIDELEGL